MVLQFQYCGPWTVVTEGETKMTASVTYKEVTWDEMRTSPALADPAALPRLRSRNVRRGALATDSAPDATKTLA